MTASRPGPVFSMPMSPRSLFGLLALALVCGASARAVETAAPAAPRYRISVCDWMILKRQKLGAFPLARRIGVDGVEVDMGGLGNRPTFKSKLGDPAVCREFVETARREGLAVSSVAMSGFYAQSFAARPGIERPVADAIAAAKALDAHVIFLPLGIQCDLVKHPELRPAIVARLRAAGRLAQAAGVVFAVETSLDAKDEAAFLDEIGSPAVKSCFDCANAWTNGRDACAELRILGRDRIAEIHCTDKDGEWLQNDPKANLREIKATLDAMGWSGWLVIERSRDARRPRDVVYNFSANAAYLKSIFR